VKQTNNRITRVNDVFAREIADIIRSELKDPRAGAIVSVLRVETSTDMKYCKVYVSILGSAEEQKSILKMLGEASGFIRKRLAERVNPRNTPELRFIFDDSMEYGFKMDKLINDVIKHDTDVSGGSAE
jgi:ribosome-binding factor A